MSNKRGKSIFDVKWLNPSINESWSTWLRDSKTSNNNEAWCDLCKKAFSLSNMGRQAILSHEKSKKHTKNVSAVENTKRLVYTKKTEASTTPATAIVSSASTTSELPEVKIVLDQSENNRQLNIMNFTDSNQVTEAEIIFCLNVVMTHMSLRAAERTIAVSKLIFPDSNIAAKLQLRKDKIRYLITCGIALYFRKQLIDELALVKQVVVCFDESFNKVSEKEQMDVCIRYWDENKNQVDVRYKDSCFLGHTTKNDLLSNLKATLSNFKLSTNKILQISMDGPNVNWSLFKSLNEEINTSYDQTMLNLGSCGLHTIHNAFKCGIQSTKWDIIKFLRAIYNFFKHVPARRADFLYYNKPYNKFPLKFCAIRWIENVSVGERAIDILPYIKCYFENAKENKNIPSCSSSQIIQAMMLDKLLKAKLCFFVSLASDMQHFLTLFQSNEPLTPLLYNALIELVKRIMSRFVLDSKLEQIHTFSHISKLDLTDFNNLKELKSVNVGFACKTALKGCKELEILIFKKDCISSLKKCVEIILTKSPLKYKMTRGASCINPENILKERSIYRLECALECLLESKHITDILGDKINTDFTIFCKNPVVIETIKKYNSSTAIKKERLDVLYFPLLKNFGTNELLFFFKTLLLLSHGNSYVERGFSINKECLVENLKDQSLVAQRLIYDTVTRNKGIDNIKINKTFLYYARKSHNEYKTMLNSQKIVLDNQKRSEADKKRKLEEIKDLNNKKRKVMESLKEIDFKLSNLRD